MRFALIAILAGGCSAPTVVLLDVDAGQDSAAIDGYVQADGRLCTGPDEDEDQIPNACDNCFNIPNLDQEEQPSVPGVGRACHAGNGFEAAKIHALPEPFDKTDLQFNFFTAGSGSTGKLSPSPTASPDRVTGGNFDDSFNMMLTNQELMGSTAVVTATASHNVASGVSRYGVLLRASLAPLSFLACYVTSDGKLALGRARADCGEKQCGVANITEPASIPPELLGNDKHGIRMSIATSSSSTTVECRVFSLKNRTTLFLENEAPYAWSVRAELPNTELPPGLHLGFFVQGGRASFYSSDLLTDE